MERLIDVESVIEWRIKMSDFCKTCKSKGTLNSECSVCVSGELNGTSIGIPSKYQPILDSCKYYEDGQCNRMSREDELSEEILKLNEEIKLLQSDNQSLKNMVVKMCYERYGE